MLLITGSNGQLARCLAKFLPNAIFATREELDITDESKVLDFVEKNNIDTIVNCAAYTAVDKAEDDSENARKINVDGVRNLGKSEAKVIHISTDYVFDGTSCIPYKESDATKPKSIYGLTKLEGEKALFEVAKSAIVIRTSWVYSTFGNNFLKTMLRLGKERESLNVVFDQVGTPTFAEDLASAIVGILPNFEVGTKEIYHYSNEGVCSWYDFAVSIMKLANLNCKVLPIESSQYPTKAVRPAFSVLNKNKIKNDFNIKIPHWEESVKKCLNQF